MFISLLGVTLSRPFLFWSRFESDLATDGLAGCFRDGVGQRLIGTFGVTGQRLRDRRFQGR